MLGSQKIVFEEGGDNNMLELLDVAARAYREHYSYLWNDGGDNYIQQHYNGKTLLQELRDVRYRTWLIRFEGKAIGFLKLNLDRDVLGHCDGMELERVYILKDFIGQGIGSRIMGFVIAYARNSGRQFLWLKAMDQFNPVHFYQRIGFQIMGRTSLELPYLKEKYKDMVIMGLNLQTNDI